jgi:ribonuclease BN (tRNA processing enzyme)
MPRPGEPCSSYLVRTSDTAVVLDIGTGAFARLEQAIDYTRIDAIVISHMHADHFFDLVPFRYALKYGHLQVKRRTALWIPPHGRAGLEALRKAVSSDTREDFFDAVFDVLEYNPQEPLRIGNLQIRFQRTMHYIETYAMRLEEGGRSLTYSADTAPCDAIVEFARASSIFLCEAALGLGTESGQRGHTRALEAGEMAKLAGTGRLVLTHYPWRDALDDLINEAEGRYHGPIIGAQSGLKLTV